METLVKERTGVKNKIERNVFDESIIPVSGSCSHNGSTYSEGATVEMNGAIYKCSGGSWVWHRKA